MRIEFCGSIASGKTTLAGLCDEVGYTVQRERFQENPFFDKFYADPAAYAFEAELTYLLQHFSQAREAASETKLAVDFSLALDLAYARVTLSNRDQLTFDSVLARIIEKIGLPSLIVRLKCPPDVALSRIHRRKRVSEQGIAVPFLEAIDSQIEKVLLSPPFSCVPVCRIDSGSWDFRPEGKERSLAMERLIAAMQAVREG